MTDQPSNAPDDPKENTGADAREPAPADLMRDDRMEGQPGGGGLCGEDADGGTGRAGGPSPGAPVDASVSAGDAGAAREAGKRSTDETTR